MTLAEVENFHPEEGMVLANTTSVGMKPKIDETPMAKVCFSLPLSLYLRGLTFTRQIESTSKFCNYRH